MKTRLRKIGNSGGITLSKTLLDQYQFDDEVEIIPQENGLLILPVKVKPREKWDDQFKKAKIEGHVSDKALLEGFTNDFDKDEWTW